MRLSELREVALFSCSNTMCADDRSLHICDLRLSKEGPMCHECFENGSDDAEEIEWRDLPPFDPFAGVEELVEAGRMARDRLAHHLLTFDGSQSDEEKRVSDAGCCLDQALAGVEPGP